MIGVRSGFLNVLYGGNATSHAAMLSVGDRGVGCSWAKRKREGHCAGLSGRSRAMPISRGSTLGGHMAGTIKAPRSTGSGRVWRLDRTLAKTPSRAIEHGPYRPNSSVARTMKVEGRQNVEMESHPAILKGRIKEKKEGKNYSLGDKYLLNRLRGKQKVRVKRGEESGRGKSSRRLGQRGVEEECRWEVKRLRGSGNLREVPVTLGVPRRGKW